MALGNIPLKSFFNVNGKLFKEKNLKELWDQFSEEELLSMLEKDFMLHKRPVLVGETFVLFGFKQKEWESAFGI